MSDRKKETHTRQVLNCASAIRKVRVRSMKFLAGRVTGCKLSLALSNLSLDLKSAI